MFYIDLTFLCSIALLDGLYYLVFVNFVYYLYIFQLFFNSDFVLGNNVRSIVTCKKTDLVRNLLYTSVHCVSLNK